MRKINAILFYFLILSAPLKGAEGIVGYYQANGYPDFVENPFISMAMQDGLSPTDSIGYGVGYRVGGSVFGWTVTSWTHTNLTEPTKLPYHYNEGHSANTYRIVEEDSAQHRYHIYWGESNYQFGYTPSASASNIGEGDIVWTIEETSDGHYYLCWDDGGKKNYLCYGGGSTYIPMAFHGPSIQNKPLTKLVNQFDSAKTLKELVENPILPAAWTIYVQATGYPLGLSLAGNGTWKRTGSEEDSLAIQTSLKGTLPREVDCKRGTLVGWAFKPFQEPEDAILAPGEYMKLTDSTMLYAVYSIPRQTIRCHTGLHATLEKETWQTGWPFIVPTPVAEDGYAYLGWTTVEGSTHPDYPVLSRYPDDDAFYLPDEDVDLYAVVEKVFDIIEWSRDALVIQYNGVGTSVNVWTDHGSKKNISLASVKMDNAIYRIPFSEKEVEDDCGNLLHFEFLKSSGASIGEAVAHIPTIIKSNTAASSLSEVKRLNKTVVLPEATYTADTDNIFSSIIIYGGGKLVIPQGQSTSIEQLSLVAGTLGKGIFMYQYPQLVNNGILNTGNQTIQYQYIINTADKTYAAFSLPVALSVKDITYRDGTKLQLNGTLWIDEYDGELRATTGQTGWKAIKDINRIIQPGEGLTIAAAPQHVLKTDGSKVWQQYAFLSMPLTIEPNYTDNIDKKVSVLPHPSDKPNDTGWNLIGNPFFATYSGAAKGFSDKDGISMLVRDAESKEYTWSGALRYVVIPNDQGTVYQQIRTSKAVLPSFKNFFVQIGYNDSTQLVFAQSQRAHQSPLFGEEPTQEQVIELVLTSSLGNQDQVGILIAPQYSEEYEFNADLAKWMNEGLNIYVLSNGNQLAYYAVNEALVQHVELGCVLPQSGEYHITVQEDVDRTHIQHIWLMDSQTQKVTDLLVDEYVFSATEKKQSYSLFLCVELNKTPTDLSPIEKNNQCQKIMLGDQLYIIKNAQLYSIEGLNIKR